jgi:hypothetical protein
MPGDEQYESSLSENLEYAQPECGTAFGALGHTTSCARFFDVTCHNKVVASRLNSCYTLLRDTKYA